MTRETHRGGARPARFRPPHRDRPGGKPPGDPKPDSGLERIFGRHSVRALLLARPQAVKRLLVADGGPDNAALLALAAEAQIAPEFLAPPDFQHAGGFSRDEKHQGIVAFATPRPVHTEKDFDLLAEARMVLALDQISDPQNLATMVRSAAFFGVEAILVLRDRSADVSPGVVRYAAGGAEFVKLFRVTNLSQSLEALKDFGFFVVGLDERGAATLAQTRFPEKLVLVVGAEGDGLRAKTKRYCDALTRIPGGRRGVESLNAGVATAIAMAEVFRLAAPPADVDGEPVPLLPNS